jgi:2Fe-2S ferredoxin
MESLMPKVNFIADSGETWTVDAEAGQSVMEVALANEIPGIVADCGGSMSCATCHVYVGEGWLDKVGQATGDEADMLELAIEPDERSRLSCQIPVRETSQPEGISSNG